MGEAVLTVAGIRRGAFPLPATPQDDGSSRFGSPSELSRLRVAIMVLKAQWGSFVPYLLKRPRGCRAAQRPCRRVQG